MCSVKIRSGTLFLCVTVVAVSLATSLSAAPLTIFNTGVDNSSNAWGTGACPTSTTVSSCNRATPRPKQSPTPGFPSRRGLPITAARVGSGRPPTARPDGNYVYRTTFNVPNNAILSTVSVTGDWATDDPGTDIRINNTSTGQTSPSYSALTPFSINSGFVLGTNTLDFYVTNVPRFTNPTGLRVDHISGTYQVPEPYAAFLAAWLLRRRRSFVAVGDKVFRSARVIEIVAE